MSKCRIKKCSNVCIDTYCNHHMHYRMCLEQVNVGAHTSIVVKPFIISLKKQINLLKTSYYKSLAELSLTKIPTIISTVTSSLATTKCEHIISNKKNCKNIVEHTGTIHYCPYHYKLYLKRERIKKDKAIQQYKLINNHGDRTNSSYVYVQHLEQLQSDPYLSKDELLSQRIIYDNNVKLLKDEMNELYKKQSRCRYILDEEHDYCCMKKVDEYIHVGFCDKHINSKQAIDIVNMRYKVLNLDCLFGGIIHLRHIIMSYI